MKKAWVICLVSLAGCASGPHREKYVGQPGDPMFFVQSPVDLRGTVERWSGTRFTVIYPNAKNECRTMSLVNIKRMLDEIILRSDIENNQGLVVPAQQFVSVKAEFSHVINSGGGLQQHLKCTSAPYSILPSPTASICLSFP
jgi:hypothetical protein